MHDVGRGMLSQEKAGPKLDNPPASPGLVWFHSQGILRDPKLL